MNLKTIIAKPKGIIVFIIIFCFLVVGGLTITFFQEEEIRVFIFFFILFVLYSMYMLITKLRVFKLTNDYFISGFTKYNYNAIDAINLYDTRITKFLFIPFPEKCVTLTLKNGKKINLLDDYVGNLWQIRYFIEKRVIDNDRNFDFYFNLNFYDQTISNKTTPISTFTKFLPYIFISLGIVFFTSIIPLFFNIYEYSKVTIISFLVLLFMVVMFSNTCYIESCNKGIIIRNLLYKHVNKKISLKLIKEINLETIVGKKHTTLLVIKMIYHKQFKFGIDGINQERTENIIKQIHLLNIPFSDNRYFR